MANKVAPRKTQKELDEAKRRRLMIILMAVLMVGTMIIVPLAVLFNPTPLHEATTDNAQKTGAFNSIVDALMFLPENANYVRYADLNASSAVSEWALLNIGSNMPNASIFGKMPLKDVVASVPYPTLGLATIEDPQVVVLSDFGTSYDNASYQKATAANGAQLRIVQGSYAFSTDTYPTISGRQEYVAAIDSFMRSSTATNSAYASYADLFEQANLSSVRKAQFATVGISGSLGFGDRYYAGVTPVNDTMCDYKIVIHLNQTLNESRMQDIAVRWQDGAALYGIDASTPQFKTNYVVMSARGDTFNCLNDMVTSWDFTRG
jgi:hypothetical protein